MSIENISESQKLRLTELVKDMYRERGKILVGTNDEIFEWFVKPIIEAQSQVLTPLLVTPDILTITPTFPISDILSITSPRNIKHQPSKLERVYNSLRYRSKKRRHKRKKK